MGHTLNGKICLISCSYAEDYDQLSLLLASIKNSNLRKIPHYIVVHTEDIDKFQSFNNRNVTIIPTADILPSEVETRRINAKKYYDMYGRRISKALGSASRYLGHPRWPSYTGWHTQQICKLVLASRENYEHVLALDSDSLVSPNATLDNLLKEGMITCFTSIIDGETTKPVKDTKVLKWNKQANRLFDIPEYKNLTDESYFDTPFIFHAPTVRQMMNWLESQYHAPWWKTLLNQPARRWSEFATYRTYLRNKEVAAPISWVSDAKNHYIFFAYDKNKVRNEVEQALENADIHFITIHSQASGRRKWNTGECVSSIKPLIDSL